MGRSADLAKKMHDLYGPKVAKLTPEQRAEIDAKFLSDVRANKHLIRFRLSHMAPEARDAFRALHGGEVGRIVDEAQG